MKTGSSTELQKDSTDQKKNSLEKKSPNEPNPEKSKSPPKPAPVNSKGPTTSIIMYMYESFGESNMSKEGHESKNNFKVSPKNDRKNLKTVNELPKKEKNDIVKEKNQYTP